MSIDHCKLLALASEIQSAVGHAIEPDVQHVPVTWLLDWAERLRALAQPAEAVEDDHWSMAAQAAVSHLDYETDAPQAVKAALRQLSAALNGTPTNDAAQGAVAWIFERMHVVRYADEAHGIEGAVEWRPEASVEYPHALVRQEWARNVRPLTNPQATPCADALTDIPSSLLSVPDWAIAAAYRAAVSRLVPDARMSALAFASEVTVAADHEWHSRLGSQDYMSDPLALAQWLRLHYRGEFPTPELRAIYELLVDTRSQP